MYTYPYSKFGIKTCKLVLCLLITIYATACSCKPQRQSYLQQYTHIDQQICHSKEMHESEYFLIILVDARHLDYSNSQHFLQTFTKHPSNGSKEGSVGHAWIYLKGEGEIIEGGHTGEFGVIRPRYVEGIMQLIEQHNPNPIKYLWEPLNDGCFQSGSGGHSPSYAAKFDLTKEQYYSILTYIDPNRYPYKNYSLTGRQCTTLASQVAALAGIYLDTDVTMSILPTVKIAGFTMPLWENPKYSKISFASPDKLEQSLIEKVQAGEAECAMSWYRKNSCNRTRLKPLASTIFQFPYRYQRHKSTF